MSTETWPVEVEVPVAWGDMDAFQHVNNTVFLRWFETARIAYFSKIDVATRASAGNGPILARATVDFKAPVTFPDRIKVRAKVEKIGNTSFTMKYQAESQHRGIVAEGEGIIVMFDYKSGTKVPVDDALRGYIEKLERGG